MRLDQLDLTVRNELAAQYRSQGMVVIPNVDLPDAFAPQLTDMVFLNMPQACEVYIANNVEYAGPAPTWRQIMRRRPAPGATRRILIARGDFFTGLGKVLKLLADAGGTYHALAEERGPVLAPTAAEVPSTPEAAVEDRQQPVEFDAPIPEDAAGDGAGSTPVRGHTSRSSLRDLVEEARRSPKDLAGREDILAALKTNLLRESKPGIVLLGKEGVGKTALVEMLARDIARNSRVPPGLADTPVYDLPLGSLVENGRYVGDIERQARRILSVNGRPIFFVDEIHQLARPELRPLCDILKPALASGSIRMIGATTPVEWRRVEDAAFKRRFLEMTIKEPKPAEVFVMMKERVQAIVRHHGISIPENLLREAIMLGARYLPMRQFPDKVIDIIDLAAAIEVARATSAVNPLTAEKDAKPNEIRPPNNGHSA